MLAAELALVWRSRQVDRWQSSDQSNWLLVSAEVERKLRVESVKAASEA
jgi:hypothetical protein